MTISADCKSLGMVFAISFIKKRFIMKKGIFVIITAMLLVSCGHDRHQENNVFDENWERHSSIFHEDSTLQEEPEKDATEKPQAVKTSSKATIHHTHKASDNMRGFDPASEDDMDDNGMSRYFENNDEEGWD